LGKEKPAGRESAGWAASNQCLEPGDAWSFALPGAALDIGAQVGIPDLFTLIVVPQRKIYSCGVIWRKGRRIGVRFASPNESPPA
jgi:hypothetical protein